MTVPIEVEVAVALEEGKDDTVWFCYEFPTAPPGCLGPGASFQFSVPDARAFLAERGVPIDRVVPNRNPQRWTWMGSIEKCYEKLEKASPGFEVLDTFSDEQLQEELARMELEVEVEASEWVDLS